MSKFKTFALSALVLFVGLCSLTACNDETPCEGEIINKEFLEAYSTTRVTTTTIYNGTTFVVMPITYIVHYPDRWRITVQWYSNEKFESRQIYVTEDCYNSVAIGEWFVYDKSFCSYKEPYTQERK